MPTLCRVLHAYNLCRQRIQHLALWRDEDRARAWLKEMMTFFSTDEILALDETANDRLAYRCTIDWDLRYGTSQSAQTIVYHRGFEDWYFNDGIRLRYARRETRVVPPLVTSRAAYHASTPYCSSVQASLDATLLHTMPMASP